MLLRVNPTKTFWGYDGYWFTSDDSAPQEIDLDIFSAKTREVFVIALQRGILLEVDKDNKPVVKKKVRIKKDQRPMAPVVSDVPEQAMIQLDPVIERKLNSILEGGVTSIRREVALITNAQFLSVAVGLEKKGKNRKTVITLLEKQMQKSDDYSSPMKNGANIYDNLIQEEKGEEIEMEMQKINIETTQDEIVQFTLD